MCDGRLDALPRLAPPMRIAVLGPPWFAVPPDRYGGIESIVALLADGLVEAGHDVTLFATADSMTRARLVAPYPTGQGGRIGQWLPEMRQALACLHEAETFDVISDHTSPIALSLAARGVVPVLHTVHGPLDGELGTVYEEACAFAPRAALAAVSLQQRAAQPSLPWVATCANALDLAAYPFEPSRGGDLVFIGRMCPEKGAHRAIAVARELGLPLKLAGKCREPDELEYFERNVRPDLGGQTEYLGEVDHADKLELMRTARAVLFPIDWEEPFGLVMVEAMACGAPIIATRRGAVPEVIDDGLTGIVVDDYRDMAAALDRAEAIDSEQQRRVVEERFSPARMVADYEQAFEGAMAAWAGGGPAASLSRTARPLPPSADHRGDPAESRAVS
jgi:glycosyltransferase involved in cell wall biosynthesis